MIKDGSLGQTDTRSGLETAVVCMSDTQVLTDRDVILQTSDSGDGHW